MTLGHPILHLFCTSIHLCTEPSDLVLQHLDSLLEFSILLLELAHTGLGSGRRRDQRVRGGRGSGTSLLGGDGILLAGGSGHIAQSRGLNGYHPRQCIGTTHPLIGTEGRLSSICVGVQVALESAAFAGNLETHGGHAVVVEEPQCPRNFTDGRIQRPLAHECKSPLRLLATELREVVHIWRSVHHFVVSDAAFALATEEKKACIRVVERHEDPGCLINLHLVELLRRIPEIPHVKLPLASLAEANCDGPACVPKEYNLGSLATFVGVPCSLYRTRTNIRETYFLVPARRTEQCAPVVPSEVQHGIGVVLHALSLYTFLRIPNPDGVIDTGTGEHITGHRVERGQGDLLEVPFERDLCGIDVVSETTFRNLPQLDGSILARCSQHVIMERVEVEIQNFPLVPCQARRLGLTPSGFAVGLHEHCPTPSFPGCSPILG